MCTHVHPCAPQTHTNGMRGAPMQDSLHPPLARGIQTACQMHLAVEKEHPASRITRIYHLRMPSLDAGLWMQGWMQKKRQMRRHISN
jgi:hypothetical protein